MPSIKTHCYISKSRTGIPFTDLHKWIDEPQKEKGKQHRECRHILNEETLEYVKKRWGTIGVIEWLFHISIDYLSSAHSWSKLSKHSKNYNYIRFGLKDTNYLYYSFEEKTDEEIEDIFVKGTCPSCGYKFFFDYTERKKITCPKCKKELLVEK